VNRQRCLAGRVLDLPSMRMADEKEGSSLSHSFPRRRLHGRTSSEWRGCGPDPPTESPASTATRTSRSSRPHRRQRANTANCIMTTLHSLQSAHAATFGAAYAVRSRGRTLRSVAHVLSFWPEGTDDTTARRRAKSCRTRQHTTIPP
jgi:hypothetical protein